MKQLGGFIIRAIPRERLIEKGVDFETCPVCNEPFASRNLEVFRWSAIPNKFVYENSLHDILFLCHKRCKKKAYQYVRDLMAKVILHPEEFLS